jgi:hypothetical protein
VAQVQQAVHVGVGEVAEEFAVGHLLPCMPACSIIVPFLLQV